MKKLNLATVVIIIITYATVCAFQNSNNVRSCIAKCKDGTMEIKDSTVGPYCIESTSKVFTFGNDSIEVPDCNCYHCSGKIVTKRDSSTGKMKVVNTLKALPDDTPFYLRPQVYIKLSLSPAQQTHLDIFKKNVFYQVNDTGIRSQFWFELSSIERAMKDNDAISYIIGLRHLTEVWVKVSPSYEYSKKQQLKKLY